MFAGRELVTSFQMQHGNRELYSPDFAALARSFGVASHTVTHAGEVEDAITTAIAANRPYLIEVPVEREIEHANLQVEMSAWSKTKAAHAWRNCLPSRIGFDALRISAKACARPTRHMRRRR